VDPLDSSGVARAAVETLAENFVDGFLTPIFWYLIGGISAILLNLEVLSTAIGSMLIFKIVSTLDSMIGYKNLKYAKFGMLGAKLDDIMNYIPARLSIIILLFGSWISGFNSLEGFRIAMRDRLKHDSPNAGHAESFVAGALGVRLGGPTSYAGKTKNKPWLGDGEVQVDINHVIATVKMLKQSAWIALIFVMPLFFFN
jgi:adenosylcobinamide-phosphate synthase